MILSSSALMVSAMYILICRLQSHLQDQYSLAQLVWWTPPSSPAITRSCLRFVYGALVKQGSTLCPLQDGSRYSGTSLHNR